MLVFRGPDNSKLVKTEDGLYITFDETNTDGMTLTDITDLEFDEAMFVRGLYFSGIYALDFYRIYTTEPITAKQCELQNIRMDNLELRQLYKQVAHFMSQAITGNPVDYRDLLAIQSKIRPIEKRIKKNMSLCRKFVYSKVEPQIFRKFKE